MVKHKTAILVVVVAFALLAVQPAAAVPAAPDVGTWRGVVEEHGGHFDYVGSPCPVESEVCIQAIYTYRIVPLTQQAARALPRVAGGGARLTGYLDPAGDEEHQGTLYVTRVGGAGSPAEPANQRAA